MFLGITVEVANWNADYTAFSLLLPDNPLVEFVEVPTKYEDLQYCNVLCGVIMGALEMVQLNVGSFSSWLDARITVVVVDANIRWSVDLCAMCCEEMSSAK